MAAPCAVILHVSPSAPAPLQGGPCCENVWALRLPPLGPASHLAMQHLQVLVRGPWWFILCARVTCTFLYQKKEKWSEHFMSVGITLSHSCNHVQGRGPDVTLLRDLVDITSSLIEHTEKWIFNQSALPHLTILSNRPERCPFEYL